MKTVRQTLDQLEVSADVKPDLRRLSITQLKIPVSISNKRVHLHAVMIPGKDVGSDNRHTACIL